MIIRYNRVDGIVVVVHGIHIARLCSLEIYSSEVKAREVEMKLKHEPSALQRVHSSVIRFRIIR